MSLEISLNLEISLEISLEILKSKSGSKFCLVVDPQFFSAPNGPRGT